MWNLIKKYFNIDERCENPLIKDSIVNRVILAECKKHGCLCYGRYYKALPQSFCRRCGKKTGFAMDSVPEWNLPELYEK